MEYSALQHGLRNAIKEYNNRQIVHVIGWSVLSLILWPLAYLIVLGLVILILHLCKIPYWPSWVYSLPLFICIVIMGVSFKYPQYLFALIAKYHKKPEDHVTEAKEAVKIFYVIFHLEFIVGVILFIYELIRLPFITIAYAPNATVKGWMSWKDRIRSDYITIDNVQQLVKSLSGDTGTWVTVENVQNQFDPYSFYILHKLDWLVYRSETGRDYIQINSKAGKYFEIPG